MLRRPRLVLTVVALLLGVLTVLGTGVTRRLSPTSLDIPGSSSSQGNELLRRHFGDSAPFAILLRGPAPALERQGPDLVRALRRQPGVTTLSPWDRGSVSQLRPSPRSALIIADFHVDLKTAVDDSVDQLNSILDRRTHPPVRATQTSYATLSSAIQQSSISAAERCELIALPILLIVLLIVFRSPIAAAIPLAFGAITVAASRGVLYLLAGSFQIDAFALTVCTMMGLALGVDYALLMVSRFREELQAQTASAPSSLADPHKPPPAADAGASEQDFQSDECERAEAEHAGGIDVVLAAKRTRRTAGRTTAFAGSTLLISMAVAFFIVPGSLLASLAATVALVVVLSVAVATIAGPALLTLLGPSLDRWRIGKPADDSSSGLMAFVSAALRRPAPVAIAIGLLLLILAAPALGLKTGPPSPTQLPKSDPARQDSEAIAHAAGAGFESPFVLVAASRLGPITEPARLRDLARWQRKIAAQPGVQTVIGLGAAAAATEPLRARGNELLDPSPDSGPLAGIERLGDSLDTATKGVGQVRGGIAEAADGAQLISQGSGTAQQGAEAIARGLGRATGGTRQLIEALEAFSAGTQKLAGAQHRLAYGTRLLKIGTHELIPNLRLNGLRRSRALQRTLSHDANVTAPALQGSAQGTEDQLHAARVALEAMTSGRSDPSYETAIAAVRQAEAEANPASATQPQALAAELKALRERLASDHAESKEVTYWLASGIKELKRIADGAATIAEGEQKLLGASKELVHQSGRLLRGVAPVSGGIERLSQGATRLAAALAELTGGTETLQSSLAEGFRRSYPLQSGLQSATVRITSAGNNAHRRLATARRRTPGIFDSGYFVLSALDGAPPRQRQRASEGIDLEHGGQAATLLVFSKYPLNSRGSVAFNKRLQRDADAISSEMGLLTGVGGGPATLDDYGRITRDRIPVVVAAITLATFLILILILRSIPLAAIAVGLNLATVGVAFGILTVLTDVPEGWPLGGHTYIDSVGATIIFGIVFGLSIDYAVFLLVRMRESYDRDGDHEKAVAFGLEKTARVITGAAAIMLAVFIAFAGAGVATVSQLGIGLTVAVLLDATVVRIVLLPALMLLIGERVWWLPRWLDKAMPRLNV